MFGISCAPEMYQKVIRQVLQDCEGAHNILDDVIVHATTEEEHDQRFENVVRVLSSKGLTLNCNKCQFKMSHLEFMGHVLSARGIGPADVKVKAVVEAREPKNAAEVRSFRVLLILQRVLFQTCQQYQHLYADLQRMENHLCGITKSNNRLMS